MGIKSYRIDKPGQLEKKFINQLIKEKKPVLFDCIIDPEEIPPIGSRIKEVKK